MEASFERTRRERIIKYQTQLYIRHGKAIFAESLDRSYIREEKLRVIECISNGESPIQLPWKWE